MSAAASGNVVRARATISDILARRDPRLLVIVGPCSIHDERAALEYAQRLAKLSEAVRDEFYIVMRVYFEKPRTTIGWRGMIIDPRLDYSSRIPEGLQVARRILLSINEYGVPTATEMLDPIVPSVHRRPGVVGGHWGAHHRVADASRNGQRPVDAGRLQEQHRRQPADRHRRHYLRPQPAPIPRRRPGWPHRRGQHPGQPGRPRDPARRPLGHELRLREREQLRPAVGAGRAWSRC